MYTVYWMWGWYVQSSNWLLQLNGCKYKILKIIYEMRSFVILISTCLSDDNRPSTLSWIEFGYLLIFYLIFITSRKHQVLDWWGIEENDLLRPWVQWIPKTCPSPELSRNLSTMAKKLPTTCSLGTWKKTIKAYKMFSNNVSLPQIEVIWYQTISHCFGCFRLMIYTACSGDSYDNVDV